jgi:hypothetical protein
MGSSLPPPATLDLVSSAARRSGRHVELILARAHVPPDIRGDLVVRLTKGTEVITAGAHTRPTKHGRGGSAADSEIDVVAEVPSVSLTDGKWRVELGGAEDEELAVVTARLLVQGRRPVVLLWGARAKRSTSPRPRQARSGVQRTAITVLETGLRVLPGDTAERVRVGLRRAVRQVRR